MSGSARRLKVFISYARVDLELVERLVAHLGPLRDHLGLIELFWDQSLAGGDVWATEIDQHLDEADLILLCISPSFLKSRHCRAEQERALERHAAREARVVPISLYAVDREATPLAALNWLPRGAAGIGELDHPDPAFAEVAIEVRRFTAAVATNSSGSSRPAAAGRDAQAQAQHFPGTQRTARRRLRTLKVLLASSLLCLGVSVYHCTDLASSLREARMPVANVQLVDLEPPKRGPESSEPIVDSSRPANLLLHVFDDEAFEDYGAIIRDRATGGTCWQSSGLHRTNDGFAVDLPTNSLSEGRYAIELLGLKHGRSTSLASFGFRLRRGGLPLADDVEPAP